MEEVKTANTRRHHWKKAWSRYLKTRSTRSIEAILRTKRFDAGFFWLEYYPLLRDMFLIKHKQFTEKDFETLLQIHANQPFTNDDIRECYVKPKSYINIENYYSKTSMGIRSTKSFIKRCIEHNFIKVYKKNGRYNKKLFIFTRELQGEMDRLYRNILCLSKIKTMDHNVVDPKLRKSKAHYRKMKKQNALCDKFKENIDVELKTDNGKWAVKLSEIRSSQLP